MGDSNSAQQIPQIRCVRNQDQKSKQRKKTGTGPVPATRERWERRLVEALCQAERFIHQEIEKHLAEGMEQGQGGQWGGRHFPGHPVHGTPGFHCEGLGFNPWLHSVAKKLKIKIENEKNSKRRLELDKKLKASCSRGTLYTLCPREESQSSAGPAREADKTTSVQHH